MKETVCGVSSLNPTKKTIHLRVKKEADCAETSVNIRGLLWL